MAWQIDVATMAGIEWFIFDTFLALNSGDIWFDESFRIYFEALDGEALDINYTMMFSYE